MGDGQYAAISGYLEHGTHPAVFTKSQKFVTKKPQKLQAGKRQAVLQGTDSRWIRLWSTCEKNWNRVFLECHLTAGGHRGKDDTAGGSKRDILLSKLLQRNQGEGAQS